MPVDESFLRDILDLYRIQDVRTIIDEMGYSFKSNKKEELIDELVDRHEWTENEVDELVERYRTIAEGKRPLGNYILNIDNSPDLDDVATDLVEDNEAEFNSDGDLISGGYQIGSVNDERLEATLWSLKKEKQLDTLTSQVQESTRKDSTGVIIDTSDSYVRIRTTNYQRAKGIRSSLQELGFELDTIGHTQQLSDTANEYVDEFVNELESELENERSN